MTDAITRAAAIPGPRSPLTPAELAIAAALDPLPEDGAPLQAVLEAIAPILEGGIRLGDPNTVAHLHPAPLIAAAAAELAVATTNQSMDAFDASPAGTFVEDALVTRLAQLHGLGDGGSGVMTMGGTASNLLGLLLARDRAGTDIRAKGLPQNKWRIVASQAAHDSVRRSAALLGLGTDAVIGIPTDATGALDPDEIPDDEHVIAFVGTAGTTDLGAIDPLDALADKAQERGAWFHVDAAVGSGLTLSDRHRHRLTGIERADSVTADLHKLWWMPFGASALLDTSRRFDALKVLIAFRATGRKRLGEMVDTVLDLTQAAAHAIEQRPELSLVAPPSTIMVAFRHAGGDDTNIRIHRSLFASGKAVIGRSRVNDEVALKLTLMNPATTVEDVDAILDLIVSAGRSPAA